MSSGLVRLPFDAVHQIARRLDVRSYDSLGRTCRPLYQHLRDENTSKKALQASLSHSLWVQLALSPPQIGLRHTLGRISDSQTALQQARPYSASIIAHASSFAYSSGILCYVSRGSIRILNFNAGRDSEKILSGHLFANEIKATSWGRRHFDLDSLRSIQVLSFADEIVVLLCDFGAFGQYLFAVSISDSRPQSSPGQVRHPRVRLCIPLRSIAKLFVRHNSKYLVVGSHSATGTHSHHEWLLEVFNLETSEAISTEPLQLREFYGSEIGSTVCFTIFQDEFYAVTNQTSFESVEVDWTSFYHVVKFRLDEPHPAITIEVIWRRQHLEGPINDAWTDLGFQIDHCTGELLIVECRKEWINGGSRSVRTYYTQPFRRVALKSLTDCLRHPPNDPLNSTLDENSDSRYEESMVRIERYVHAEFQDDGHPVEGQKEYIRAKTKWNGYSFNAQSYVDLVTDEFVMEGGWRPRQRIKIRVVSRQELSPLVISERPPNPSALFIRKRMKDREGQEMEDGERAFSPSHVFMWPPDDAPQELHDVLCPEGRAGEVKAALGDEGIIYMAGPELESGSPERALVFICFDPTFGFAGMKRLDGTLAAPKETKKRKASSSEVQFESLRLEEVGGSHQLAVIDRSANIKRPKTDSRLDHILAGGPAHMAMLEEKPEPDLPVLPQGDVTAQALGLDPPKFIRPGQPDTPDDSTWPPRESTAPTLTLPPPGSPIEPESSSNPLTSSSGQQDISRGKARALPPTTSSTWRERAAYISIGRGFWLR